MRIGIDLGGTKIEGISLSDEGAELHRIRVDTPRGDYDGTLEAIRNIVAGLERFTGMSGTIGVGIPGTIVSSTGLVKNANSLWLNQRPLEQDLSRVLKRPVRCANDANCFAVSEATDGAARGYDCVFGVIAGTGCGGGLAINGIIRPGPNGVSGEWGHIPLPWPGIDEYPGEECYCGKRGCLEKWISGTGFERDFFRVTGRSLRGKEIYAASQSGDVEALSALERLADRMARGMALLVNILDPDAIVIGGGLSNIDWLYPQIEKRIAQHTFGGTHTPVLKAMYGDSSGVRGAAWLWPVVASSSELPHP